MDYDFLDNRPIVIAIAGSNGAGKSTFYHSYLSHTDLRFINADDLALELGLGPYEAAQVADALRRVLVEKRESFIFETVLSDPVGEKVGFLCDAAKLGYEVALIFIRIADVETSVERVSMRRSPQIHDRGSQITAFSVRRGRGAIRNSQRGNERKSRGPRCGGRCLRCDYCR